MKKTIIIITLTMLLILSGCKQKPEEEAQKLINQGYDIGELKIIANSATDTYAPEEIEEGITIKTQAGYNKKTKGYQGYLTYEIENTGEKKEVEYTIEIPKSFAETFDKIKTPEEIEIIKNDPVGKIKKEIPTGKTAIELFTQAEDLTEEVMNRFMFDLNIQKCKGEKTCLIRFLIKKTELFKNPEEDCNIFEDQILSKACRAFILKDPENCEKQGFGPEEARDASTCKLIFYSLELEKECKNKDYKCLAELGKKYQTSYFCAKLKGDEQSYCLAISSGDKKYCEEIKDDKKYEECTGKKREAGETEESEETEEEPTVEYAEEAECPEPIPEGATKIEFPTTIHFEKKIDGTTKIVGYSKTWFTEERKQLEFLTCRDAQGREHGPKKQWYSNTRIKMECQVEHGQQVGCTHYCEAGGPSRIVKYKNNKEDGIMTDYDCKTGKVTRQALYEEGKLIKTM